MSKSPSSDSQAHDATHLLAASVEMLYSTPAAAIEVLGRVLLLPSTSPRVACDAHRNSAIAHCLLGNYESATAHLDQAIALATRNKDPKQAARCRVSRAIALQHLGQPEDSVNDARDALVLAVKSGQREIAANALAAIAVHAEAFLDFMTALMLYEEAVGLCPAGASRTGIELAAALCLTRMEKFDEALERLYKVKDEHGAIRGVVQKSEVEAAIVWCRGRTGHMKSADALTQLEWISTEAHSLGYQSVRTSIAYYIGDLLFRAGDFEKVLPLGEALLKELRSSPNDLVRLSTLDWLSRAYESAGNTNAALQAARALLAILKRLNSSDVYHRVRIAVGAIYKERHALDGLHTLRADAKDRSMREHVVRQLVDPGSHEIGEPGLVVRSKRSAKSTSNVITGVEKSILERIALGETNTQIAEVAGRSPNTIRNHVVRIMAKLGASTRTEAVMIAVDIGIIKRGPSRGRPSPEYGPVPV